MSSCAARSDQVIDSADLEADNPLMESGMDSLSGRKPMVAIGNFRFDRLNHA